MDYEGLIEKLLKGKKEEKFFVSVVPISPFGEVLLGKRTEDGIWTTPGGGAEPGEEPHQAARRELFEEAGLVAPANALELVGISETPRGFKLYAFMWRMPSAYADVATAKLDPDKEVKSWKLYRPENFPSGMSSEQNASRLKTIREALMKLYQVTKSEQDLTEKLNKGGPGSGVKGHLTPKKEFGGAKNNPTQPYDEVANIERKNRNAGEEVGDDKNRKVKPYTTSGSSNQQAHEKRMEHEQKKKTKASGRSLTKEEIEEHKARNREIAENEAKREPGDTRTHSQKMADTRAGGPNFKRPWGKGMEDSNIYSLIDKLNKGGPGSGVQGHVTAKQPSPLHPHVSSDPAKPMNKLQTHLQSLQHGAVIPGIATQSGKPVTSDMAAARAHGYDVQDHIDAMNAHYEMAQKTQKMLDKLKTAGHKVPAEGAQIARFHEKKMREHMKARKYLEERTEHTEAAIKEKKKEAVASVKKSITQMGGGLGDRDLDVGSFAQANGQGHAEWMEKLYSGMEGQAFGDDPKMFETNAGTLHLARVDDGIYSGYFTKKEEGLADNAKIRIERITIPELVQLMVAKEWISNHMVEEAKTPELMAIPSTVPDQTVLPVVSSMDQKIQLLSLIDKLLN